MAVESRTNFNQKTYILHGDCKYRKVDGVTGFGTSGRDTDGDMVKGTVMCWDSSDPPELVPLTSLVANDGTSIPCGILHCTLSEAELEAVATSAVVECLLLTQADCYNENELVFDGASPSITLDSIVITDLTEDVHKGTVRDLLEKQGIYFGIDADVSDYES